MVSSNLAKGHHPWRGLRRVHPRSPDSAEYILDNIHAFLNTEYYVIRLSNKNPALVGEMLSQVLEPEDRERYARVLRFLDQQAAD